MQQLVQRLCTQGDRDQQIATVFVWIDIVALPQQAEIPGTFADVTVMREMASMFQGGKLRLSSCCLGDMPPHAWTAWRLFATSFKGCPAAAAVVRPPAFGLPLPVPLFQRHPLVEQTW